LFRVSVEATERARTLRRDLGIDPATIVVFAVGRLVRKKGFEYLIDAAATLSRAESGSFAVVIAGKGDLHAELEERARAKRVQDAVMLVGDIDRPSLPSYFAMADIVVVPSVRDAAGNVDGLPNVLLEAMASASAIVASDVAGIPQAIRSGRDGILVAEKDPEALAAAIASLAASEEKRSALGESARTRALEAFNWNLVGERFESVFRTVAQTRCRTS
jgi:glycosyltransferase involved in cell wall biosynthesis